MSLRRLLGGGGGAAGGGGGGGGGSMLRAVGRVVSTRTGVAGGSAGLQEPVTPNGGGGGGVGGNTTPTTRPTSPRNASVQKLHHQPSLSAYSTPVSPRCSGCGVSTWQDVFGGDEGECVFADGGWEEVQKKYLYLDELVLGSVPSADEVHSAVSAVQQAFDSTAYTHLIKDKYSPYVDKEVTEIADGSGLLRGVSSGGTDVDWIEPALHLCYDSTSTLEPLGSDRVYDAFHLLQTDASVQRMVISLSSDKAVWDAVLNNEVVKELRKSCSAWEVTSLCDVNSEDESNKTNEAATLIKWIFDNTISKIMEVVDKMTRWASDLFVNPIDDQGATAEGGRADHNPFEEKLRTSFLLLVVVLLVVAMTRARRA